MARQLMFEGPRSSPENVIFKATIDAMERQTRGQSENPDWFALRRSRITASIAHTISHSNFANGKAKTLAETNVRLILGEERNLETIDAINWGNEKEPEAVRKYRELKSDGRQVVVWLCGFFIDPQHVWLGATPDRIVEDEETGDLLCLEVFCPYKHRENTMREACQDETFCLELGDEDQLYRLKPDHKIYTQVQCQMAVTGIHKADLAVFTKNDIEIVPVTFNPEFWDETVTKLSRCYREFLRNQTVHCLI